MSSRLTSWRAVLRIARRDALRAKGRSALVVAMIALPVMGMSFADVLARSGEPSTEEALAWRLGAAQAELWSETSGPVQQSPDVTMLSSSSAPGSETSLAAAEIVELLPAGTPAVTWSDRDVRVRTATGTGRVHVAETDVGHPVMDGRLRVIEGRAPERPSEVAVTPRLLDRLGAEVGDDVELTDPAGSFEIVGLVDVGNSPRAQTLFAVPGALPPADDLHPGSTRLFVGGDDPLAWNEVLDLNEQGVYAYSRAVVLDPPPDSAVPLCEHGGCAGLGGPQLGILLAAGLVMVLAGLEVGLLAGAAFAVGARRQAHALGLLAATGGEARDVRRVVLAGGLVLGVTGGVLGVILGGLGAAVAIPLLEHYTWSAFPSVDIRPLELLGIAAVGTVTGVIAAVLPARQAARQDPVAALHGRRPTVRTPRKVPVIALIVTGAGVAMAAAGSALAVSADSAATPGVATGSDSTAYLAAGLVAGGAALALIGLIVLSPAVVGLAGRLGRHLPLAPRLALRDAARHRGRSAPAVAAVLAAVTGSVALSLYVAAIDDYDRRSYGPTLPMASAGVSLLQTTFFAEEDMEDPHRYNAGAAAQALRDTLPVQSVTVVQTAGDCMAGGCRRAHAVIPPENRCPLHELARLPTEAESAAVADDPRCAWTGSGFSYSPLVHGLVIGGPDILRVMTGTISREAESVLAAGGVVVPDPRFVVGGHVQVEVVDPSRQSPEELATGEPLERLTLPAAVLDDAEVAYQVWSPAAAERVGLAVQEGAVVADLSRLPTQAEEDAFHAALAAAGLPPEQAVVERGYVSDYGIGLLALVGGAAVITLGAVGIATGLAQADARPDHVTLAAVGAQPRLRRTLAACQALSIAGIGGLLGIAAGFVPGVAFIWAMPEYELVIPWSNLALVLVALPLLAAAAAWLCTRSRLPLSRRAA